MIVIIRVNLLTPSSSDRFVLRIICMLLYSDYISLWNYKMNPRRYLLLPPPSLKYRHSRWRSSSKSYGMSYARYGAASKHVPFIVWQTSKPSIGTGIDGWAARETG